MSRIYDALKQMEKDEGISTSVPIVPPAELFSDRVGVRESSGTPERVKIVPASRLVAFSNPKSLGAEKFRVLVTRLENLRRKKEIRSLQVTSSVVSEGKTLIATNLAITLAQHSHAKVLLVEGDLHRPGIARLLGIREDSGIGDWWSDEGRDMYQYLCQIDGMSLWFLGAGRNHDQPSQILQSPRFSEAFNQLIGVFDWIIVDSTPMLPVADANLWSRLVDGTLLVVREGTASVEALKKGLASVDGLKLIGTVLNEASESDRASSSSYYYGADQQRSRHQ